MKRRDKYIRAALKSLLTNSANDGQTWHKIAETAVYIADAAIATADASESVEAEPEPVEDGEPKVGDWCMFRDYDSTNWDGPWKLLEIRNPDYEFRYRHTKSFWRQCRRAKGSDLHGHKSAV